MRITSVKAYDFLNKYTYTIPFNLTEHITIIHGPNGCGKTNLLTFINALFNRRFLILRDIPFRVVRIFFDNGHELRVFSTFFQLVREYPNDSFYEKFLTCGDMDDFNSLYFEILTQDKNNWRKLFVLNETGFKEILPTSNANISDLENLKNRIRNYITDQKYESFDINNLKNLQKSFEKISFLMESRGIIKKNKRLFSKKEIPDPLYSICKKTRTTFIQTQRILSFDTGQRRIPVEEIINCSKDFGRILAKGQHIIKQKEKRFEEKLRKNGNKLFLKQDISKIPTVAELDKGLQDAADWFFQKLPWDLRIYPDMDDEFPYFPLNFKEQFGLNIPLDDPNDWKTRMALSLFLNHIDDIINSIRVLDTKILLLENLMQDLSLKAFVSGKTGVDVVHDERADSEIPLPRLSSGEQHIFIIFFTLLFRTPPGTLVLIDEPEISLHIHWQRKFLKTVKRIQALNPIDVIIATHSPDIIFDRRDLSVSLRGENESL